MRTKKQPHTQFFAECGALNINDYRLLPFIVPEIIVKTDTFDIGITTAKIIIAYIYTIKSR